MSTRWTLATQPSHVPTDAASILADAYAFLISIARRPVAPDPDIPRTDPEGNDEEAAPAAA